MNTTANSEGDFNSVGNAFQKAEAATEEAAAASAAASSATKTAAAAADNIGPGPVPQASRNVSPKRPGTFSKLVNGVTSFVKFVMLIRLLFKPASIVAALITFFVVSTLFESTPHTSQARLHGNLKNAGFFKNIAFKLDTGKTTTIHGRGTKVESITVRDSGNRLYRTSTDGEMIEVKE